MCRSQGSCAGGLSPGRVPTCLRGTMVPRRVRVVRVRVVPARGAVRIRAVRVRAVRVRAACIRVVYVRVVYVRVMHGESLRRLRLLRLSDRAGVDQRRVPALVDQRRPLAAALDHQSSGHAARGCRCAWPTRRQRSVRRRARQRRRPFRRPLHGRLLVELRAHHRDRGQYLLSRRGDDGLQHLLERHADSGAAVFRRACRGQQFSEDRLPWLGDGQLHGSSDQ